MSAKRILVTGATGFIGSHLTELCVGEDHAGHLIPALEILGSVIALVFVDNTLKLVSGQQTQKLCKDIRFVRHDSISVRLSALKPSFY